MSAMSGVFRWRLGVMLCVALCGCLPSSQGPLDEQKEPHYLAGKARQNERDWKGAIESFEKALEANPQNSMAHFALGDLFEKESDYAAAIYHFERHLKLRPDSDFAELVKDRIISDKMELSKSVALAPMTQKLQRDFDNYAETNRLLEARCKALEAELAQWKIHAEQLRQRTNATVRVTTLAGGGSGSTTAVGSTGGGVINAQQMQSSPGTRTHTVKDGETPTAIARKYGIKVEALMAANPGVDARRIKVGQVLRIPAS